MNMHRLLPLVMLIPVGCAPSKPSPSDQDTRGYDTSALVDDDPTAPDESPAGLAQLDGLNVKNVIVIHADTLRLDRLPMYGHTRQTSPNLFTRAFLAVHGYHATAPWTLPSTSSALSALTPEHHGNVTVSGASGLADAEMTVAERFQDAGYVTGAFSGNRVVSTDFSLARGFDVNLDIEDLENVEAQAMGNLWSEARTWLEGQDEDAPFYLWLQPMDTHPPYRPEAEFRGTWADYDEVPFALSGDSLEQEAQFQEAYDAATTDAERAAVREATLDVYDELVYQQDSTIGDLFAWLLETGHQDDTLVVFTADHGETIADDHTPTLSHMQSLRPELVELPLIFYHPTLDSGWTRCISSNVDLGPTLVQAAGLDALPGVDGFPVQDGCRDYAFSSLYFTTEDGEMLQYLSVMDDAYKLDVDCSRGSLSFFDLVADPATLDPLDLATSPALAEYHAAIISYYDNARALNPELDCSIPPVAIGLAGGEP